MGKIELVENVLAKKVVERPPVCLWYHFGVHHGDGERFAELSLDYFFHYDFDFLKVMNDYHYPLPPGTEAIRTGKDIDKLRSLVIENTDWKEQLKALRVIRKRLDGKALFVDTVFDPWHTLKRALAGENLEKLMEQEPVKTLKGLDVITDNLVKYCRRAIGEGAAGIFLSIPAGEEIVKKDHFVTFVKPFARIILDEVKDLSPMNIAHIHGEKLHMDECLDLPAQVFNWWDRGPECPSLSRVGEATGRCVMGGIDHTILPRHTIPYLRAHVREGMELGGKKGFFLTGGCSISPSLPPRVIRAIVSEAKKGGNL